MRIYIYIGFLSLFICFITPSLVLAKSQTCIGNDHTLWTNCYGELRAGLSGTYYGEFLDGKRHGIGLEIKPDGKRIEGYWSKGIFLEHIEK